jgi:chromate transporter
MSHKGSIADVFLAFLKLGLTSFGGPFAHIGYFRREFVDRRNWVTEGQYGQLLAICQLLPGPASSQLGFALGLLRGGAAGACAAFVGFTLPSALLLVVFASAAPRLTGPVAEGAMHGLKLVACAVVADALLGMAGKLCPDIRRRVMALLAAAALIVAGSAWLQIAVVGCGALAGLAFCRNLPAFNESPVDVAYGKRVGVMLGFLFLLLLVALPLAALTGDGLVAVADAFYRAGALVFGGGHVVLPLLEESVVAPGWIDEGSFLAGYGAAQAVPGPMFAFSAYLGVGIDSGHGSGLTAATALLMIFLPGLLLVSAVLPLWQTISARPEATSAIAGINAAVVGVLGAALYDPLITSSLLSLTDLAIAAAGFLMLRTGRVSPLLVVVWCVAAAVAARFL